jgi:Arc/MetJ family transcription regulator
MINAMVKKMEGMSAKQLSAMVDNGAGDEDEDETHAVDEAKREAVESRIKDIDVAEDVEALMQDEDELSEEFKVKAATIFEAAVKSKVRDEVERIADELSSDKQKEVGTFKEELSDKVDDYLNYVVEEWSKENELAIERGLKGEIAEDFINGLQQLFTDHYIDVPNERYDVLEAQSDKISDLEDKLNEVLEKSVKLKESNDVYMREQVIIEVSDDLADTEVEKFKSLTEDVDFVSEDKFREKLETIKENYFPKVSVETAELDDEIDGSGQTVDTTGAMKSYMSAITRNQQRAQ